MSADTPPRGSGRLATRLMIVAALALAIATVVLLRPGGTGQEPQGSLTPATQEQHEPIVPDLAEPAAEPRVEQAAAAPSGAAAEPAVAPAAAAGPLPRLVDLGADKCVPCKMMAPILAELRQSYAGRFEVVFIDVWKERPKAAEYGIQVIPTQIFYDAQGKELYRHQGFFSREEILQTWRDHGLDFGDL